MDHCRGHLGEARHALLHLLVVMDDIGIAIQLLSFNLWIPSRYVRSGGSVASDGRLDAMEAHQDSFVVTFQLKINCRGNRVTKRSNRRERFKYEFNSKGISKNRRVATRAKCSANRWNGYQRKQSKKERDHVRVTKTAVLIQSHKEICRGKLMMNFDRW